MSKILNRHQLRALARLGDLMIPQNEAFPSFSQLGCLEHIDLILSHAPKEEMADLKLLLTSLALMPTPVLKQLIQRMKNPDNLPAALAPTFRLMDLGLRGIIFTLYYSGKVGKDYLGPTPLELIGYSLHRVPWQRPSDNLERIGQI